MRILAHVHGYPPTHLAGAEQALHGLLAWLVVRGHTATVYAPRRSQQGEWDGVTVVDPRLSFAGVERLYRAHDLVITHLNHTRSAVGLAKVHRTPLVFWAHSDNSVRFYRLQPGEAALVLFCAEWAHRAERWRGPALVLHPPISRDTYRVARTGTAITLVNLTREKGVETFYAAARALPEVSFLGVIGGYGDQVLPPDRPANVEILAQTADMREVYGRTRVVLMPSGYESFGRVAMEAAASGIPTICHPTPGLRECLADAGIFVDRRDVAGYVEAILALQDARTYRAASRAARQRYAAYLKDNLRELREVETALVRLVR